MSNEIKYGLAGVIADDTAVSKVMPKTNSLVYRGYAVQDLATQCQFEETAFLILYGELPNRQELLEFTAAERKERFLPENLLQIMRSFSHSAHPMDTLRTAVSYLGQEDHQADLSVKGMRATAIGLLAKIPTIIAASYRLGKGLEPIAPDSKRAFCDNFFHMCFGAATDQEILRCFDISMTLYAEHSFNASTFTARTIVSSESDFYSAVTGAIGSLKGPLHGGANEAVQIMLEEIASPDRARQWLLDALAAKQKIMGFGHRVYRSGDSRVPTMTKAFHRMVDIIASDTARNYRDMSNILAETMLAEKNIHPNLDFPTGPAYHLMGFPTLLFTPIFVMSRITGWGAHIIEQSSNNRLIRPLSNYIGHEQRHIVPLRERS